ERGEVRRTQMAGDTLVTEGMMRSAYVPLSGGRFRLGRGSEIRFEGDGANPTRMLVRGAGGTVVYTRADAVELTAAQLAEYAGDYRNDEIDATHTWKIEKDKLVAYSGYRRLGELDPSYKDGFTRGGSVIDIVRDRRGRITGYTIQSGRVRDLRFTRVR
ncbi:MAG: hypothetical protein ACYC2K_17620, partial [Gemmatimonadales bacterium]